MKSHAVNGKTAEKTSAKRSYVSPKVSAMVIELEYGIAAQSAITVPHPERTQISLEWETGIDKQTDFTWQ